MGYRYEVITTQEFEDDFKKLDNSLKEQIKKRFNP
jgi:mRNA-degrading endonuclease RelE of RelBE toxin-antitoxin system